MTKVNEIAILNSVVLFLVHVYFWLKLVLRYVWFWLNVDIYAGIQTSEDYRFYVISAEYPELGLFVSPDLNQDYLFDVVCSNSLFFICLMNFPCCLIVFIVDMGVQGGDCLVRGAVVMVFEGDGYGCTIFFSCNLW